jgi:hypothetical protein
MEWWGGGVVGGGVVAPRRGWRTQPRVSTPVSTLGTHHPKYRALNGRQIERPNNAEVEFKESNCNTSQLHRRILRNLDANFTGISLPFRANRFFEGSQG